MGWSQERLRETFMVKEATRRSMQGNRARDTKPEMILRAALRARGHQGYRKNPKDLPGRPDIVFRGKRVAVFVHGCFWHDCPKCRGGRTPQTNSYFWAEKFRTNRERDERKVAQLQELGFCVIVIWECDLKTGLDAQVAIIERELGASTSTGQPI